MSFQRRTDREKTQVGSLFDSERRYYDQISEITVIKLYSGEYYVADGQGQMVATVLGSCIAACAYDPIKKLGGINHFLLADHGSEEPKAGEYLRYGQHAMDALISGMLSNGAELSRLQFKLFGGANVTQHTTLIGDQNIRFARSYLAERKLPIIAEDVGGNTPRRVHFFTDSGKARIRTLRRESDMQVLAMEEAFAGALKSHPIFSAGGAIVSAP
jgi:chemotaxis protein CheD